MVKTGQEALHSHKGGGRPIINPKVFTRLAKLPLVENVYAAIPDRHKQVLRYWIDQFNVQNTKDSDVLPHSVASELNDLYAHDFQRLIDLGFHPPWSIDRG